MIRPLRQWHRRFFFMLAIFLPATLVIAVVDRRTVPVVLQLPEIIAGSPSKFESVVWARTDLFPKSPVSVRLLQVESNPHLFAIRLSAPPDFLKPDLLVYWSASEAPVADRLPGNAVLLGTFASSRLQLPATSAKTSGTLVLYSLADGEVVDASKPLRFNNPAR